MVERDDFYLVVMRQEESGLVSEDIWEAMVAALRRALARDLLTMKGETLSRGRHHKGEGSPFGRVFLRMDRFGEWRLL